MLRSSGRFWLAAAMVVLSGGSVTVTGQVTRYLAGSTSGDGLAGDRSSAARAVRGSPDLRAVRGSPDPAPEPVQAHTDLSTARWLADPIPLDPEALTGERPTRIPSAWHEGRVAPVTLAAASAAQAQPAPSDRAAPGARFDPAQIQQGREAFETSCTQCHDAERALAKRKSFSAWLATVRRMSRMEGAEIDEADMVPIATFLASRGEPAAPTDTTGDQQPPSAAETPAQTLAAQELAGGLSISATISTLWRGGNDNLENPGFFPDVWLRADWQPAGPLRGRVTSCTSCHSDQIGNGGFTLELVEAAAYFDLIQWLRDNTGCLAVCDPRASAEIKAGRFVVPFGGYAALSHPGIYRTVTNPLMYNMGRQVNRDRSRPPVLPMPYSDEGVDLAVELPSFHDTTATLDVYVVNGLAGAAPGVQFTRSRSYTDNNAQPAVGGRATIGSPRLRLGGSVMSGRMENEGDPELNYHLTGADATFRPSELVRLYFEYAIRRNDTLFATRQITYGTVSELELLLWDDPNLSFVARYDTLEHRDDAGEGSIERFTWGLNTTILSGSLFIIDHEHWNFPSPQPDADILGFRWVVTF